jgi:peptidyl-prolyl cis-trans isomerase C
LIRFIKEPLVQFLLIGACIYAAYALFGAPDETAAERTVVISEDRIDSLAAAWQKRWNRPPTEQELVGLVRTYLREDILYREAVAMGLDKDDHIVRRRLAQKLEFLTNDIVQLREPAEGELEAFFSENRTQFQAPDLVTFIQVFFNPDTRGDATLADAEAVLTQLQAAGVPDPDNLDVGDRFMLRSYFVAVPEFNIRRQMGSGFAESVMQLEPGRWHGPVLSGFGPHLVYVYQLTPAPLPELDAVRDAVMDEWQRQQTEQFNVEFMDSLKTRYDIVIEAPPEFSERVLRRDNEGIEVAIPDGEPAS